jgi:hypothetical protein
VQQVTRAATTICYDGDGSADVAVQLTPRQMVSCAAHSFSHVDVWQGNG